MPGRRDVVKVIGAGLLSLPFAAAGGSRAFAAGTTVGMLPKFTSDPYFQACDQGAQEAAKALGVTVEFNGPVNADVAAQSDIVDRWVRRRISAITVAANDANALAPSLKRAIAAGIKVSSFDSDVAPDAREVFLNQATFEGFARTMADLMVQDVGTTGDLLIVTGVLTAPNQNRWIDEIKKYYAERYPNLHIAAVLAGDEDIEKSKDVTLNYLKANPATKGVFCVAGPAAVGVSEAVKQLGLAGKVAVTGLGAPSLVRPYIKAGVIKHVALWSPIDIGYAAIYIADAQVKGTLKPGSGEVSAGRLGELKFIAPDVVLLGKPLVIDAGNVDSFKF